MKHRQLWEQRGGENDPTTPRQVVQSNVQDPSAEQRVVMRFGRSAQTRNLSRREQAPRGAGLGLRIVLLKAIPKSDGNALSPSEQVSVVCVMHKGG